MRNGQVGMEALVIVGLIVLLVGGIGLGVTVRDRQNVAAQQTFAAKTAADQVAAAVDQAAIVGSGYARNVTVPQRVATANLTLSLVPETRAVAASWTAIDGSEERVTAGVVTAAMEDTTISASQVVVRNVNGTVEVEPWP